MMQSGACRSTAAFPQPGPLKTSAAYVVKDSSEQKLTYVYDEEEAGWHSTAKILAKDDARRIAANVAKLAEPQLATGKRASLKLKTDLPRRAPKNTARSERAAAIK